MTTVSSRPGGSSSSRARSGVMPMPAPMSDVACATFDAGVQPAVGALDEHPGAGPQPGQPGRGVADRGGGEPQGVAVGGGGEGVGVGPGPAAAVEEAPGEELPAAGGEPVQVAAPQVHAGHRRRLLDDVADDAGGARCERTTGSQHPEDEHRGQAWRRTGPTRRRSRSCCREVRAGPQLVGEGQAGAEVGVEVEQVPGLVAQPPAGRSDRGHHDHDQGDGAGEGQQHARGVEDRSRRCRRSRGPRRPAL